MKKIKEEFLQTVPKTYVSVTSYVQTKQLLEALEAQTSLRWHSGHNPTEWSYLLKQYTEGDELAINTGNSNGRFGFAICDKIEGGTVIAFEDFFTDEDFIV